MGLLNRWDRTNARYLESIERERRANETNGTPRKASRAERIAIGGQLAKVAFVCVLVLVALAVAGARAIL